MLSSGDDEGKNLSRADSMWQVATKKASKYKCDEKSDGTSANTKACPNQDIIDKV
jgi:hypothetical protein